MLLSAYTHTSFLTLPWWLQAGILLVYLGFVSLSVMFFIWWERKVSAHMQSRLGPMRTGGWHGWSQSLADGLKLFAKEDLVPQAADRPLFRLAPYLTFVPAFAAFVVLPFSARFVFSDLSISAVFIFGVLALEVIGVILAGWASNNKWALYGAMREACQMVSYEIPMGLSILVPALTVGTLSLTRLGADQGAGLHAWLVFRNPFLFVAFSVFFIASLASCKRAPFDLPESESELVAGFMTEYSGMRWVFFMFAEYSVMFLISGLAVLLFLGGWYDPFGLVWRMEQHGYDLSANLLGSALFVVKGFGLVFVQMWLRWTLPRLRIDQVLYMCVKVLLPLACIDLVGAAAWTLLLPRGGWAQLATQILLTVVGSGVFLFFFALLAASMFSPRLGIRLTMLVPWNQVPLEQDPAAESEKTTNA